MRQGASAAAPAAPRAAPQGQAAGLQQHDGDDVGKQQRQRERSSSCGFERLGGVALVDAALDAERQRGSGLSRLLASAG